MDVTLPRLSALRFADGALWALDQTALPWVQSELELRDPAAVSDAIRRLSIRGAPLIGVAAGYGLALGLEHDPSDAGLREAALMLRQARPTAVNLAGALEFVAGAVGALPEAERAAAALRAARSLHAQQEAASETLAGHGADLLRGARTVLTHCNTGALAAPGAGTALAVLAEKFARGTLDGVIATESRPLLQGARLTIWELGRLGIPHELVVDSAAAGLIASGGIDAVIVGADRIAACGDVANKVGTYGLALAAREAGIPFVVAAPISTIDPSCPDGGAIEIEERPAQEILTAGGQPVAPAGTRCRNPAFDITPAPLITAIVTERGLACPPTQEALEGLLFG